MPPNGLRVTQVLSMPASQRDLWPHDRTSFPMWARLLREAFSLLVRPNPAASDRPLAVTLVSEACLAGLLGDLEALAMATSTGVRRFGGAELGHTLDKGTLSSLCDDDSLRLVIIERVDLVGDGERQQAAAAVLDDLARKGLSICVTAGRSSLAGGLHPTLQTRLSAGLVVHVPYRLPGKTPSVRSSGSLSWIIRTAARSHGLPATSLSGSGRSRRVVQARNLAMYLARHLTGSSFGVIGAAFGGRDHTTVLRGVRAVETQMVTDATFAADVERLLADAGHPPRTIPARHGRQRAGG